MSDKGDGPSDDVVLEGLRKRLTRDAMLDNREP